MAIEAAQTVGVVLGGGRSIRFGSPKGLAKIGGRTMIDRVLSTHREAFEEIVVVTDDAAIYRAARVMTTPDLFQGQGPVAGIHAALSWAAQRGAVGICCTPCDAPFVKVELFRMLLALAPGADAALPRSNGPLGFEPLFGWYATRSLPIFDSFLEAGGRAAHELIPLLSRVRYIPIERFEPLGGADRLFLNVNTPEDLVMAQHTVVGHFDL